MAPAVMREPRVWRRSPTVIQPLPLVVSKPLWETPPVHLLLYTDIDVSRHFLTAQQFLVAATASTLNHS
jgi:hypothetical protein